MKKGLIYLFMLVLGITSFTACNDDDKDNGGKPTDNAEAIAGIYRGDMAISFSKTPDKDTSVQNIYITRTGKDVIKVELKKFKFGVISVGDITVENINVVNNNGTYSFTGSQALKLVVGEVNVDVTGTVSGNEGTLQIIVKDVVVVGDVTVKFVGNKVTGLKTDAQITAMTFSDTVVVGQPVINGTAINFYVAENADSISLIMAPTITVSEGASVSPVSGVKVNFNAPVTYTVTAEDGVTTATYTVSVFKLGKFDFESWDFQLMVAADPSNPINYYEVSNGWASSNMGVFYLKGFMSFLNLYPMDAPYAVERVEGADAKSGKYGAKLQTLYTTGAAVGDPGEELKMPMITAGSLYLGKFDVVLENTLESTQFGVNFYNKPVKVKGYYKFTPGDKYYHCPDPTNPQTAAIDGTKSDECAINAVLYEASHSDAKDYLDGTNIFSSEKIVARAELKDGSEKTSFTEFDIEFVYDYPNQYDPKKEYKLALIFSSSKYGDKFSGAPGSTLIVDDVEIISE